MVLPLVASPFASESQVPTFRSIASGKLRPPPCRMPLRSVNRHRRNSSRDNDAPRFRHRPYAFDTSSVVSLQSSSCQSPDLVLPRPFPPALTTMAFDHSRQGWFGTCSCQPVPRGRPSSIKQLHTLGPPRPFALVAHRRLRTRLGAPKAITAMARKLACLFYRLIKHGQQYVDQGTEYYETRYREQQIRSLAKRAQKLGLQLIIPKTA